MGSWIASGAVIFLDLAAPPAIIKDRPFARKQAPMTTVTLYHNPRCRTSRTALELLRKRGIEPTIIEYLNTPPTAPEIKRILKMLDIPARELLRVKEGKAAGLSKDMTEAQLVAGMAKHPIAIERPIAIRGRKAALGRPAEKVLTVL
jgi:arsenate reductase (glutaredoxin)